MMTLTTTTAPAPRISHDAALTVTLASATTPAEEDYHSILTSSTLDLAGLSKADVELVHDFHVAWEKFLNEQKQQGIIMNGRNRELQTKVRSLLHKKQTVESELEKQLEFVVDSEQRMEDQYQAEINHLEGLQQDITAKFAKLMDQVKNQDDDMFQYMAWNHFLDSTDKARRAPPPDAPAGGGAQQEQQQSKMLKPSARAMALVDPNGNSQDLRLRAYQMDHALLECQAMMLETRVNTSELTMTTLEPVGKFLSEHNVWGLLAKQQKQEQAQQAHQEGVKSAPVSPRSYSVPEGVGRPLSP